MHMKPKISIVIPVYNTEKYLEKCISSVLSSTLKDVEVILIDDGSTDDSLRICDEFAQKDNRIIVLHQPNQGVSVARNIGIDNAKGEWLAFVDSDDYIFPDYYKDLIQVAEDNHVDIVRTIHYVERSGNLEITSSMQNTHRLDIASCKKAIGGGYIVDNQTACELMLLDLWTSQLCTAIYKRKLFDSVRFPENRTFEDLAVGYQPYCNSATDVVVYDKPYYVYNCDNMSSITRSSDKILKRNFDIYLAFRDRYYYSLTNAYNVSYDLLRKTALHGMGSYNAGIYYAGQSESKKIVNDTKEFLLKYKKEIINDNEIGQKNYYLCIIFFYFRLFYNGIIRVIYKIKGR